MARVRLLIVLVYIVVRLELWYQNRHHRNGVYIHKIILLEFCGRPSLDLLCLHLQSPEVLALVVIHSAFKVMSSVRIISPYKRISFRASELEDTYHFRNVPKLEKSDRFGGTGGVFSQAVFDLQAPRAY